MSRRGPTPRAMPASTASSIAASSGAGGRHLRHRGRAAPSSCGTHALFEGLYAGRTACRGSTTRWPAARAPCATRPCRTACAACASVPRPRRDIEELRPVRRRPLPRAAAGRPLPAAARVHAPFLESVGQHDALVSGRYFAAGDVPGASRHGRRAPGALRAAHRRDRARGARVGGGDGGRAAARLHARPARRRPPTAVEASTPRRPSRCRRTPSRSEPRAAARERAGAARARAEREREYAPPPASDVGAREREYAAAARERRWRARARVRAAAARERRRRASASTRRRRRRARERRRRAAAQYAPPPSDAGARERGHHRRRRRPRTRRARRGARGRPARGQALSIALAALQRAHGMSRAKSPRPRR